jgi:hypothetical protein
MYHVAVVYEETDVQVATSKFPSWIPQPRTQERRQDKSNVHLSVVSLHVKMKCDRKSKIGRQTLINRRL